MAKKKSTKKPSNETVTPAALPALTIPAGYPELLEELKGHIRQAQVKAALAANRELMALYWNIGQRIVHRQEQEGWGKNVIERLAQDLQAAFPGVSSFSPRNIWFMRSFYLVWTQEVIILKQAVSELDANLAQAVPDLDGVNLPQPVAEIPWGHNIALMQKIKDPIQRLWYAKKTIENGWSRAVLVAQIESGLFERQGKAQNNFSHTLPQPQSDLAREVLKDPYTFDFLTLAEDAKERELEQGLLEHLQKFLLELGVGFAFVGRQHHLVVGGEDFYLDLLFYHLKLRCFVVIDLKMESFKPEFAGKMNFYLSAVDAELRHAADQPSIGLILCKDRNHLIVEYSLRDTSKPMGVASWQLREQLPEELKGVLPSPAEIVVKLNPVQAKCSELTPAVIKRLKGEEASTPSVVEKGRTAKKGEENTDGK